MAQVEQFKTASDFWSKMVVPDYEEYCEKSADLRKALHAAISLFHMADWVFHTHEGAVKAAFTFRDKNGRVQAVSCGKHFANSLEQQCDDFGRIRGIANAAKHLQLRDSGVRPVQNAPSNAAKTLVQTTGFGVGGYGQGPYGGGPRVMLEGSPDMEFSQIAKAVFHMWASLKLAHGW
ncbi:MAG TPA: hypothetical protein VEF36_16145 [Roseiarcus sp.]|nr:hypothetical protein [Roseiarcus sp.]